LKPLLPPDPRLVAIVLEDLRAGKGLDAAMRRAGIAERTVRRWLAYARRKGPEGEPYRRLRADMLATLPPLGPNKKP
jgi:hypothetical protein